MAKDGGNKFVNFFENVGGKIKDTFSPKVERKAEVQTTEAASSSASTPAPTTTTAAKPDLSNKTPAPAAVAASSTALTQEVLEAIDVLVGTTKTPNTLSPLLAEIHGKIATQEDRDGWIEIFTKLTDPKSTTGEKILAGTKAAVFGGWSGVKNSSCLRAIATIAIALKKEIADKKIDDKNFNEILIKSEILEKLLNDQRLVSIVENEQNITKIVEDFQDFLLKPENVQKPGPYKEPYILEILEKFPHILSLAKPFGQVKFKQELINNPKITTHYQAKFRQMQLGISCVPILLESSTVRDSVVSILKLPKDATPVQTLITALFGKKEAKSVDSVPSVTDDTVEAKPESKALLGEKAEDDVPLPASSATASFVHVKSEKESQLEEQAKSDDKLTLSSMEKSAVHVKLESKSLLEVASDIINNPSIQDQAKKLLVVKYSVSKQYANIVVSSVCELFNAIAPKDEEEKLDPKKLEEFLRSYNEYSVATAKGDKREFPNDKLYALLAGFVALPNVMEMFASENELKENQLKNLLDNALDGYSNSIQKKLLKTNEAMLELDLMAQIATFKAANKDDLIAQIKKLETPQNKAVIEAFVKIEAKDLPELQTKISKFEIRSREELEAQASKFKADIKRLAYEKKLLATPMFKELVKAAPQVLADIGLISQMKSQPGFTKQALEDAYAKLMEHLYPILPSILSTIDVEELFEAMPDVSEMVGKYLKDYLVDSNHEPQPEQYRLMFALAPLMKNTVLGLLSDANKDALVKLVAHYMSGQADVMKTAKGFVDILGPNMKATNDGYKQVHKILVEQRDALPSIIEERLKLLGLEKLSKSAPEIAQFLLNNPELLGDLVKLASEYFNAKDPMEFVKTAMTKHKKIMRHMYPLLSAVMKNLDMEELFTVFPALSETVWNFATASVLDKTKEIDLEQLEVVTKLVPFKLIQDLQPSLVKVLSVALSPESKHAMLGIARQYFTQKDGASKAAKGFVQKIAAPNIVAIDVAYQEVHKVLVKHKDQLPSIIEERLKLLGLEKLSKSAPEIARYLRSSPELLHNLLVVADQYFATPDPMEFAKNIMAENSEAVRYLADPLLPALMKNLDMEELFTAFPVLVDTASKYAADYLVDSNKEFDLNQFNLMQDLLPTAQGALTGLVSDKNMKVTLELAKQYLTEEDGASKAAKGFIQKIAAPNIVAIDAAYQEVHKVLVNNKAQLPSIIEERLKLLGAKTPVDFSKHIANVVLNNPELAKDVIAVADSFYKAENATEFALGTLKRIASPQSSEARLAAFIPARQDEFKSMVRTGVEIYANKTPALATKLQHTVSDQLIDELYNVSQSVTAKDLQDIVQAGATKEAFGKISNLMYSSKVRNVIGKLDVADLFERYPQVIEKYNSFFADKDGVINTDLGLSLYERILEPLVKPMLVEALDPKYQAKVEKMMTSMGAYLLEDGSSWDMAKDAMSLLTDMCAGPNAKTANDAYNNNVIPFLNDNTALVKGRISSSLKSMGYKDYDKMADIVFKKLTTQDMAKDAIVVMEHLSKGENLKAFFKGFKMINDDEGLTLVFKFIAHEIVRFFNEVILVLLKPLLFKDQAIKDLETKIGGLTEKTSLRQVLHEMSEDKAKDYGHFTNYYLRNASLSGITLHNADLKNLIIDVDMSKVKVEKNGRVSMDNCEINHQYLLGCDNMLKAASQLKEISVQCNNLKCETFVNKHIADLNRPNLQVTVKVPDYMKQMKDMQEQYSRA